MHIIIIGGGDVGQELAKNLFKEGHDAVVVDKNPERVKALNEELDFLIINGNGANLDVLEKAKIKSARMLIAVTESDEVNIIACMIAKTMGVPFVVARVRDPESAGSIDVDTRGLTQKQASLDLIISPEKAVAEEIAKMVHFPGAVEIEYFANGRVMVVAINISDKGESTNRPLEDLPLPIGCIILGIRRSEGEFILPGGEDTIRPGDKVYAAGSSDAMAEATLLLHGEKTRVKRVIILGGGMIGYELASILESSRRSSLITKIIEKSEERCDLLNRKLSKTIVLQGNETELSFFNDEEFAEADLVVAVTGEDRTNIVASVMCQRAGVKKIISEVTRIDYKRIYSALDITQIINPHLITASKILQHTHKENVVSLSLLKDEVAEVMEVVLPESAQVVGKKIADAGFPRGMLVGAIVRDKEVIIPHGGTVFEANDRLIIFALPNVCSRREDFFCRSDEQWSP